MQPDDLKGWGSVVGVLVAVGAFVQKVRSHGGRITKAETHLGELSADIKRRLYDDDSQPIYVPMGRCRECRADCDKTRAKENEAIHRKLDKLIDLHLNDKGE